MTEEIGHTVLLVVDVQVGLFSEPSPELHDGPQVLKRIAQLVSRARRSGVPVIYTQYGGPQGAPLSKGSPDAEIHPAVAPQKGDLVIPKDHSDAFLRTDLAERLAELDTETLIVCGLQSEFCVDSTCRTAHSLGYRVILVEDAHTTTAGGELTGAQITQHHNRTLARAYVSLARAADLIT